MHLAPSAMSNLYQLNMAKEHFMLVLVWTLLLIEQQVFSLYLFQLLNIWYNHIIKERTFCILIALESSLLCPSLNSFSCPQLCSMLEQSHLYYFNGGQINFCLFYIIYSKNWLICHSLTNHCTDSILSFYSSNLLATSQHFYQSFISNFKLVFHPLFYAFA